MLRVGVFVAVALIFSGCGLKGELYLPPSQSAAAPAAKTAANPETSSSAAVATQTESSAATATTPTENSQE